MLELFQSYLADRSQFVMYYDAKSDINLAKSVLGPFFHSLHE